MAGGAEGEAEGGAPLPGPLAELGSFARQVRVRVMVRVRVRVRVGARVEGRG